MLIFDRQIEEIGHKLFSINPQKTASPEAYCSSSFVMMHNPTKTNLKLSLVRKLAYFWIWSYFRFSWSDYSYLVVCNNSNCAGGQAGCCVGYLSEVNSLQEAHGRLRGFASVKRPRLAEKPNSNRIKNKRMGESPLSFHFFSKSVFGIDIGFVNQYEE